MIGGVESESPARIRSWSDADTRQFPDGVLVPIHARMVSVQPLPTPKPATATSEMVCVIM